MDRQTVGLWFLVCAWQKQKITHTQNPNNLFSAFKYWHCLRSESSKRRIWLFARNLNVLLFKCLYSINYPKIIETVFTEFFLGLYGSVTPKQEVILGSQVDTGAMSDWPQELLVLCRARSPSVWISLWGLRPQWLLKLILGKQNIKTLAKWSVPQQKENVYSCFS